jgi:hypothetical protein
MSMFSLFALISHVSICESAMHLLFYGAPHPYNSKQQRRYLETVRQTMRFLEFKSPHESQDSNLQFHFQKRSHLFYMTKAHITLELQMRLNVLLHMIYMH